MYCKLQLITLLQDWNELPTQCSLSQGTAKRWDLACYKRRAWQVSHLCCEYLIHCHQNVRCKEETQFACCQLSRYDMSPNMMIMCSLYVQEVFCIWHLKKWFLYIMINFYWPGEKKVCGRKLKIEFFFLHFPSKSQKHTTKFKSFLKFWET